MNVLAAVSDARTEAEFGRAGVHALSSAIGSDLTTLSVCNLRTGKRRVVADFDDVLSARDIATFNRYFHDHPLVRYHASHARGGAHRISDSVPMRAFQRTALYGDYYRRIGIEHAIAVPLYVDDRTLVSFVLNRSSRDFSDAERKRLDAVRGPLAGVYRHIALLTQARRTIERYRQWIEAEGWNEVVIDDGLSIVSASRRGLAAMTAACAGALAKPHTALPEPIQSWLRHVRDAGHESASVRLPEDAPRLSLRAVRDPSGDWLLYLRDDDDSVARESIDAALPLTRRESEILRWVANGKSDAQIAAIVGASVRTVQKHLEHIYTKLGVESRTAAAIFFISR